MDRNLFDFGSLLFCQVNKVVWGLLTLVSLWLFLCLEISIGNNIQTGSNYWSVKTYWIKNFTVHQLLAILLTGNQLGWRTKKKEKNRNSFYMISLLGTNCKILPADLQNYSPWPDPYNIPTLMLYLHPPKMSSQNVCLVIRVKQQQRPHFRGQRTENTIGSLKVFSNQQDQHSLTCVVISYSRQHIKHC